MAVIDDLNRLAALEVVYLTRQVLVPAGATSPAITGTTEVFRGRLRQALSGDWVFNTSTGQNGVAGIVLGPVAAAWASSESPAAGLQVTITTTLNTAGLGTAAAIGQTPINEVVVLTTVIPADLAD